MSNEPRWKMTLEYGQFGRAGLVSSLGDQTPTEESVRRCFDTMLGLILRDMAKHDRSATKTKGQQP